MSERRSRSGWAIRAAVAAAAVLPAGAAAQTAPPWRPADSTYHWSFPQDHWAHPEYKTEWWYLTGHLAAAGTDAPRFGYQFTIFRIGLLAESPPLASSWAARDLIMGHLALTDITTGRHVFSELLYRAVPLLGGFGTYPDSVIAWSRGPAGTGASWRLTWNGAAFTLVARDERQDLALELTTRPVKPLVFQGPNGYSRKGVGAHAASQYYSYTRLATRGHVTVGQETVPVTGLSWMDKEFGSNQLGADQVGWDWFSLQLDDGRDLMLYHLRGRDGHGDFARGTVVDAAGGTTHLAADDWSVTVRDRWRSRSTDAVYPSRWRVTVPRSGLELDIEPVVPAQENASRLAPGLAYWEGAVVVRDLRGRAIGRGYVELTGYAGEGRLPI